jgi:hypothetical protein
MAAPTSMAHSAVQPGHVDPHGIPDRFGRVGTMPADPGMTHFPEAWGYRNYAAILFSVAGVAVVLALFVMAVQDASSGFLILLFAAVFGVWGWFTTKKVHTDLVCDQFGVTVRQGSSAGPLPSMTLPWIALRETVGSLLVVDRRMSSSDDVTNIKSYQRFSMTAQDGRQIVTDSTRIKGLPELIAMANRSTPQLPYQWIPKKMAKGMPVLAVGGKYVKVPR